MRHIRKVLFAFGIIVVLVSTVFAMYEFEILGVDEIIDDLFDNKYTGPEYNVTGNPLRFYADALNISIGAAMHHYTWKLSADAELFETVITSEFNQMSFEYVISMDAIWLEPAEYNWKWADQVVELAIANNMSLRGTHLVWYDTIPDWLVDGEYSAEEVANLIQTYIYDVMNHFKSNYPGAITEWIVANEAVDPDGEYFLRQSFLTEKLGNDWVQKVFQWARAADSTTKLMYNDYDLIGTAESVGEQVNRVYQLVSELNDLHLIDQVGIQGHLGIKYAVDWQYSAQVLQNFTDLDLEVIITELDVLINYDQTGSTETKLNLQAEYYAGMFNICLDNVQCKGITTWGVNDKYHYINRQGGTSWLPQNEDFPLLFDEHFNPKPVYFAVLNVLQQHSA